MSNFEEQSRFPETGRMVMPGDSVIGGPNAPINLTFRTLFDRTRWLKNTLAEYKTAADSTGTQKADKTVQLTAGAGLTGGGTLAGNRTFALGTPSKITATSTNVAVSNTHSHEIDKASPTVAGIVRTNNTLTGTSDSEALSAAMGKKLADEKLGNSGDQTITDGTLTFGRPNIWTKMIWPAGQGRWIFETNPAASEDVDDSIRFNIKFEEPGKRVKILRFHHIGSAGETVAYQSWVAAKAAEAAAVKADTKKLTDEDLNSITSPGIFGQAANARATTARNYPVQKAGSLLSMPSAYNSDNELASHQIYIPFDADEIWRRGKRPGGNNWTEWAKITVSPAELDETVKTASARVVLLTGAQTVRGVKTFSDGLKTATPAAASNDTSVATTEFVRQAVDSSVPSGAVMHFAMQSAPTGWLKANGAAVSRTQYPALFAAIGTTYGAGDGLTTFNLPDLRGEFVRGWDDGRRVDRGRVFGSSQADELKAHTHGGVAVNGADTDRGTMPSSFSIDGVGQTASTGGTETRPRNIALLACIKI